MKDLAFYFDQFEQHKASGSTLYREGRCREARYHFLKAAEYLFRVARESSTASLRQLRARKAHELLVSARSLPARDGAGRPVAGKQPAETREDTRAESWLVREKPRVRFQDVAGLQEVKEQIRLKMIYPFIHPEKAAKYVIPSGGGILLYGPPGTGKTLIARAIAGELDAAFFSILPSKILSKWVGDAEKNVEKLFEVARSSARSVVFVDEIEALLPRRRSLESSVMQRVVPQILAELDGFTSAADSHPILFVGATNEPWALDYALLRPGRFDEKIYVGLPGREARLEILRSNLRDVPLDAKVNLETLSENLEGYSGADIAYLCQKARETAFREAVLGCSERSITTLDLEQAMREVKPSVNQRDLERFEKFRSQGV